MTTSELVTPQHLSRKAERGELALTLPVGLMRDELGVVHKDPNREVQDRIDLVFGTFLQVKSASQVLRRFNQQELLLPRRNRFGDLVWRKPTIAAILSILKNPAYAGAFVYGRTRTLRSGTSPHQADEAIERAHRQQLERLRYQVSLAERQFNRVDPDNRLVAAELEQRWETALRELQQAEAAYAQRHHSLLPLPLSPHSFAELTDAAELEARIVALAQQSFDDQAIAEQLTALGFRSPLRSTLLPSTVKCIRLKHGIMLKRHQSHPRRIPGYLTVSQIATALQISHHWIYDRIHNGTISITREPDTHLYLFPDQPSTIAQFKKLKTGKIQNLRF